MVFIDLTVSASDLIEFLVFAGEIYRSITIIKCHLVTRLHKGWRMQQSWGSFLVDAQMLQLHHTNGARAPSIPT